MKNFSYNKYYLILHVVLLIYSSYKLNAQNKTTVLLDKESKTNQFNFDTSFLSNTTLVEDGSFLHLNLKYNFLGEGNICQLQLKQGDDDVFDKTLKQDTKTLTLDIDNEFINNKSKFSKFNLTKVDSTICISNPYTLYTNKDDVNKSPRLEVQYELANTQNIQYQNGENAQHTNSSDWNLYYSESYTTDPSMGEPISLPHPEFDYDIVKINDYQDFFYNFKDKVVVYKDTKGNLIINDKENNKKTIIEKTSNKDPVIDNNGLLYYFATDSIYMVDLKKPDTIDQKPLSSISIKTNGKTITINTIKGEVTLGADGTLYMPIGTNAGRVGTIALSQGPNLAPRWFYNTTNPVGPVSLSKDERLAFFIETVSNKNSKLVVLNNITGKKVAESKAELNHFTNDGNSYIPAPVIQTVKEDGNYISKVYILNGYKTANKMVVYKIDKNIEKDTISIDANHVFNANKGISQPVVSPDNKKVWFIYNHKLVSYNSAYKKSTYTTFGLDLTSNDVILKELSGALFIINNQSIYYTGLLDNDVLNFKKISSPSKNINKVQFSSDSELYASTTDKTLYRIRARAPSKPNFVTQFYHGNLKNKTTYVFKLIEIQENATVNSSIKAKLIANNIYFNKGLTIKKGAELNFITLTNK